MTRNAPRGHLLFSTRISVAPRDGYVSNHFVASTWGYELGRGEHMRFPFGIPEPGPSALQYHGSQVGRLPQLTPVVAKRLVASGDRNGRPSALAFDRPWSGSPPCAKFTARKVRAGSAASGLRRSARDYSRTGLYHAPRHSFRLED